MATAELRTRLVLPSVALLAAVPAAALLWAARATAGGDRIQPWNGFSGPIEAAPRPVEYVDDGGGPGRLVLVPCAGGGTARCSLAGRY